jgi:hypothetical protein
MLFVACIYFSKSAARLSDCHESRSRLWVRNAPLRLQRIVDTNKWQ